MLIQSHTRQENLPSLDKGKLQGTQHTLEGNDQHLHASNAQKQRNQSPNETIIIIP